MKESAGPAPEAMNDLLRDRRELKRLLTELAAAHESERQRLAARIHDDVIQSMAASSLRVEQLRLHLDRPDQQEILAKLDDSLRDSITRLREVMTSLAQAPTRQAMPARILEQEGREP
jgi:signal transduction histidine kinase